MYCLYCSEVVSCLSILCSVHISLHEYVCQPSGQSVTSLAPQKPISFLLSHLPIYVFISPFISIFPWILPSLSGYFVSYYYRLHFSALFVFFVFSHSVLSTPIPSHPLCLSPRLVLPSLPCNYLTYSIIKYDSPPNPHFLYSYGLYFHGGLSFAPSAMPCFLSSLPDFLTPPTGLLLFLTLMACISMGD